MIIFDKKVANILFISSSDFFLLSHFVTSIVHKHHETLVRDGFGDFGFTA
jgi:hypothetical protein